MSLDPMPDVAELLRMKREREARRRPTDLGRFNCAGEYRMPGELNVLNPIAWPVRILLPWSHLISDNRKYAPALRGARAVIILTADYRAAKRLTAQAALRAIGPDVAPVAIPLALHARVWVPDNRPGHDVANFAKCAHDAMEGLVYEKDEWLWDPRWTRAGVDVDAPRAELTIQPLP